jgi:hypothetical protein
MQAWKTSIKGIILYLAKSMSDPRDKPSESKDGVVLGRDMVSNKSRAERKHFDLRSRKALNKT